MTEQGTGSSYDGFVGPFFDSVTRRSMVCPSSQVPHTLELLNNTQVPFALVVSPLALPDPADDQVQVRCMPADEMSQSASAS